MILVLSLLCLQQVTSQRIFMRPKTVGRARSVTPASRESKMDNDEFLRKAEIFFKNAAQKVGMTKKGIESTWKILVKYSATEQVDPTRKISPQEQKRRRDQIEKMGSEIRKTLSESDRKKLAQLERALKMDIDRKVKTQG